MACSIGTLHLPQVVNLSGSDAGAELLPHVVNVHSVIELSAQSTVLKNGLESDFMDLSSSCVAGVVFLVSERGGSAMSLLLRRAATLYPRPELRKAWRPSKEFLVLRRGRLILGRHTLLLVIQVLLSNIWAHPVEARW